jgi:hypothetical protein
MRKCTNMMDRSVYHKQQYAPRTQVKEEPIFPSEDDMLDQYILREEAKMAERKALKTVTAASHKVDEPMADTSSTKSASSKAKSGPRKRKTTSTTEQRTSLEAAAAVSTSTLRSKRGRASSTGSSTINKKDKNKERLFLYGKLAPKHTQECCAGCLGKRTEELASDPIIFCDG